MENNNRDSSSSSTQNFVGMSVDAAKIILSTQKLSFRVVQNDEVDLPVTDDYDPNRYNFEVIKSKISKQSLG